MNINKSISGIFLALTMSAISANSMAALQTFETSGDYETLCGYKNAQGRVVVPAKYQHCGDFYDGRAGVTVMKLVKMKGTGGYDDYEQDVYLQGYIDEAGKLIIPTEHEAVVGDDMLIGYRKFSDGLVAVYKNGKYGYLDKNGKLVIPYSYESAGNFNGGVAAVSKNGKFGVINKANKLIVPFKFNWLEDYSEGLAAYNTTPLYDEGKFGFIDPTGKIVIPAKWNEVRPFSEGLAAVRVGGYENSKWGIIDKTGKVIVAPTYDAVYIEEMAGFIPEGEGIYKNGKLDVYRLNNKTKDGSYKGITRYTLNRSGQVMSKKTFPDWNDIINEQQ